MGHEFAGEVVELGESVTDYQIGSKVAVYPIDFCGECVMCKKGDVHLCLNKRAFGVLDVDGAFAEYICVPEKSCFKVEDHVSYAIGSLMEPLAVAYRGVGHAGDLTGKTVLLVGTGTIGLLALACVKMKNPAKILVSDLSDNRLEVAKAMGADVLINPSKENFKEVIESHTNGKGVDVAIEAVGAAQTVQQAMSALAYSGTAIWIGNNKQMIDVNMQEIVTRELKVAGSFLYGYKEFKTVVELLNSGKLNVEPLISAQITLAQGLEYFEKLAQAAGDLIKVVVVDK
jgi:L-iditol 2-dehydrogenase